MKNMKLLHTLSLCALLLMGAFTSSVCGATVTFNDGSFSKTQGGITFSLQNSGTDYFQVETNRKGAFKYYWIEKSNDKTSYLPKISWSGIPEGYTISVTKLNFHADAYGLFTANGYLASPYHTSPDVKFYEATGGQDIEVTSTTYPSLFPTGSNSLGNTDYFQFKNTSNWIEFTNIVLTYTITNQYTVTLNNQGADEGKGGTSSIAVTYGSNTNLSGTPAITKPIKTDKVFGGYYTNTNGTGTQIIDRFGNVIANASGGGKVYTDASGNWKYVGNITLYAYWGDLLTPAVTCTKTTLSVDEEVEDAFAFENTDEATWEISGTSIDSEINNGDGQVIEYDEDNNKLIAHNSGTARITFTQTKTAEINSGSFVFDITVNKHTPTFTWNTQDHYYYNSGVSPLVTKTSGGTYTVTSDNTEVVSTSGDNVTIYNKPGTASIRVHHPETYYWEEYDHSESITPEWRNDTVSFSLTDANHTIYESANTFSSNYAYWSNDKDGYFLGATSMGEVSTKRENYAIIHFTGIPDTLYFDQKLNKYVVLPKDRVCYVMVSANGSTWNDTVWRQEAEIEYMNNQKVCLPSYTRYIKFYYNGTISSEYKNIRVSKRKYFKTDKASLDFATNVKNASCDAQTFKFYHASAGYITSVSSSDSHFTVSPVSVTTGGEICDSAVITVSYSTAEVGEHSGTITISDNIGNSTSVSVTGTTVDAYTPTITWPGATSYLVGSTIANSFVAKDNNEDIISGTWSFESSDSTVIDVVEGELKAICGGTATITGTIAEGATWSSGSQTVSLTVTRNAASFTWSNVADDDKIHVWADSDIPSSIVSANTAINGFTSGNSDRLTVSGSKGSFTLHAGHKGEVTLTATSEGDCTYSSGTSSKTIVVDPCYHSIIWEQNFQGIQADENGAINETIVLNAYAVDSLGNRTSVGITYSIGSGSCAEMKDGKLHLKGVGDATIIATTATDDKYAIVSESKPVSVVLWGVNKAQSANDESDIVGGKVVINAPHATFTFGGETTISKFHAATVGGKPEGYQLAMTMDHDDGVRGDGTAKYYFTWECTNANCSIQVTKISFWAKAYTSNATLTNNGKLSFNGEDFVAIGTAALTANDGDFKHFDKPGTYTDSVWITCKSTWQNFDFYIKNIVIEYTVYTTVPSPTGGIENLNATINLASKQTVDLSSLFGYAVAAPSDFTYSYEIVESTTHADLVGGTAFWADSVGDYTVRAKVNADEDHRESGWSSTKTIRVNRVPYIFNNGAADQAWNTLGNWNASWLPTDEDTVIVRGDLVIDREIEVKKLSIESGVVEIAPNGGLTVGAGGVSGATKDKLILKAQAVDDDVKGIKKGQTGYLRISPSYTDTMPEATVELFCTAVHKNAPGAGEKSSFQCVGAPIADLDVPAKTVFPAGTWLYTWDEDGGESGTWVNTRSSMNFTPFQGFDISQKKSANGYLFKFEGHLVSGAGAAKEIALDSTYRGNNLLANSFTAPIDITSFESEDFVNAHQTIYILNAGAKGDGARKTAGFDSPGKWFGIPINSAAEMAKDGSPCVISSMQGFWVQAKTDGGSIKLDYSKLVWGKVYEDSLANSPLRAPKSGSALEEMPITGKLKIDIYGEEESDCLYMLESKRYDRTYEDGYDANKMEGDGLEIFAIEGESKLSVNATNSIVGTRVGVRAGEETAYTMLFSRVAGETDYALVDVETMQTIEIYEGMEYTFFAEPNSNITERFMIVERADAPSVTTGVDSASEGVKAHKFVKDDQVFILKNGVLYNMMGTIVR